MIGVDKIEDIRRMWRSGCSVAEISRATGISEPTIRTYRDQEDLSPRILNTEALSKILSRAHKSALSPEKKLGQSLGAELLVRMSVFGPFFTLRLPTMSKNRFVQPALPLC